MVNDKQTLLTLDKGVIPIVSRLDNPEDRKARNPLLGFIKAFIRRRSAFLGAILFLVMALAGLFAPWLAPYDPNELDVPKQLLAPGQEYLFGTDNFGRDVFSRILYGARVSLLIGNSVVVLAGLFGTLIGLISGYFRALDNILMRLMDGLMAFPAILLGMAIMGALGASLLNIIVALVIVYTPRIARVVRGSVLAFSRTPFVESAICIGCSDSRIIFRHILPNCLAPLIVQLTFTFAYAVLAEASLTFLGIGASPDVSSWGVMINEGRPLLSIAPWLVLFPGLSIVITVLSLNLVGDGLRDALDPRMQSGLA